VVTVLDGDEWQLRGCLGREWEWHVGTDKPWDAPGSVVLHDGPVRDVFPHVMLEDGVDIVRTGSDELRIEDPELWWPNGMGKQRLRNDGDVAPIGVVLEGDVSDNVLDLLPGESRVVEVEGKVAVGGWNV
jgi:hypothetical protein